MTCDLRPMPEPLDPALVERCRGLDTATLGHWRQWGMCDRRIQAQTSAEKVIGTAVTLALPGPDGALLHDALGQLRPGDVLAIDRLGDTLHACVGGIVARAASARGASAIVVDGPIADAEELRTIGLPIWAHGPGSRTTRRLGLGGRLNAPISLAGAVVQPGDLLICDADGVAVLAPDEIEEALARSAARAERERTIIAGIAEGRPLAELLPPPALRSVR